VFRLKFAQYIGCIYTATVNIAMLSPQLNNI